MVQKLETSVIFDIFSTPTYKAYCWKMGLNIIFRMELFSKLDKFSKEHKWHQIVLEK